MSFPGILLVCLLATSFAAGTPARTPLRAFETQADQRRSASIEGKVCNAAGEPLAGVAVRLEGKSSAFSATTDAQGRFRISDLEEGSYQLILRRDGFRVVTLPGVILRAAEKKRLDALLEKDPASKNSDFTSMQFSDTPSFTVAGITDSNNLGLHGSDANVRTSDSLAKETAALKSSMPGNSSDSSRAGDTHRVLGDAKEASGDPVAAVHEYETAVKADPSEQNYFAWGAELLLHHAGQPAVQVFSSGLQEYSRSSRMLSGLAAANYAIGRYNEAAAQICRASALEPSNPTPYLFLGKMEQAAADPFSCSEAAFARFAANQPDNAEANFLYGLVLTKQARRTQEASRFARAEQLFERAITLNPRFAEVYVQLGMLYNAQGKRSAATAAFQKAVAADPAYSKAHYQLSLAYRRSGETARADQELKAYDDLRRSEEAAFEKERRELRQFVTILKDNPSSQH